MECEVKHRDAEKKERKQHTNASKKKKIQFLVRFNSFFYINQFHNDTGEFLQSY